MIVLANLSLSSEANCMSSQLETDNASTVADSPNLLLQLSDCRAGCREVWTTFQQTPWNLLRLVAELSVYRAHRLRLDVLRWIAHMTVYMSDPIPDEDRVSLSANGALWRAQCLLQRSIWSTDNRGSWRFLLQDAAWLSDFGFHSLWHYYGDSFRWNNSFHSSASATTEPILFLLTQSLGVKNVRNMREAKRNWCANGRARTLFLGFWSTSSESSHVHLQRSIVADNLEWLC